MKFGGSSVKNAERILNVCSIVKSRLERKPIVVVSALGGITDMLIESADLALHGKDYSELLAEIKERHHSTLKDLKADEKLVDHLLEEFESLLSRIKENKEITSETMDNIQSFGERMSSRIVATALDGLGIVAEAHDAFEIGMITNDDHGNAEPLEETEEEMRSHLLDKRAVPVITGFIGKNKVGTITTLGRGGSDYSAAIFGAAVHAEEIQIWTDVNGVMTTDPRIVPEAKTIPEISFDEASEMAVFGAKVLHPKTILPAVRKDIPVRVLNTYEPDNEGTVIVSKATKTDGAVKAIAIKKDNVLMTAKSLRMLNAHGYLAKLFEVFAHYDKSVDMVSTSEVSVSMTLDNDKDLDKIEADLKKFAEVKIEKGKSIITLVGEGMKHTPGIAGKIFTTLGDAKINVEMISQGASEINVSFIVNEEDKEATVKKLHEIFF